MRRKLMVLLSAFCFVASLKLLLDSSGTTSIFWWALMSVIWGREIYRRRSDLA